MSLHFTAMTTLQTEWTAEELLATHAVDEPLVVGGVRCHGGFDADGAYVSPRTLNRVPAIRAWQAQHGEQFGTELLGLPIDTWPENYPNVAQARYLIEAACAEPIISDLTRIGTVEGFGAFIRNSILPDWQTTFVEDIRGTAIAHLGGGLYEAHARDEAGLRGRGRPQADVVRQPRHRVREPRHRGHDRADARAHGHRHAGSGGASTPPRCGPRRWPTASSPTTSTSTSSRCSPG